MSTFLDRTKINFEAACKHYRDVLERACSKRILEDVELDFMVDFDTCAMSYKDLYYRYLY